MTAQLMKPTTREALIWITDILIRYHIPFQITGGLAVQAYGSTRPLADIDIEVTRYSLAYINHNIHTGDNGRVLGYDNDHGYHHRHYMGEMEPVEFKSFVDTEIRFKQEFEKIQKEFEVTHEKRKKKK